MSDPGGSTSVSVCAYVCVYVCVRASSTPLATHILQVLCESSGYAELLLSYYKCVSVCMPAYYKASACSVGVSCLHRLRPLHRGISFDRYTGVSALAVTQMCIDT